MDFISKISVTCFAASYAIGLGSEIVRVFWPTKLVRWLATAASLAGVVAQTLFLIALAVRTGQVPIVTQFESLIAVSWLISLIYVYLLLRDRRLAAGIFLLPVILGLSLFAGLMSNQRELSAPTGVRVIGMAHGILLLLGTVLVAVSFVAALMYLVKVRQLKSGTLLGSVRLPSLERLDRVHSVAVHVAWPMLTIGIGLGFALQQLNWTDPKVITTVASWLLFTFLVHYRHRPENRGRKVAMLTIVSFVVVLIAFLGDPIFGTGHQSNRPKSTTGATP